MPRHTFCAILTAGGQMPAPRAKEIEHMAQRRLVGAQQDVREAAADGHGCADKLSLRRQQGLAASAQLECRGLLRKG